MNSIAMARHSNSLPSICLGSTVRPTKSCQRWSRAAPTKGALEEPSISDEDVSPFRRTSSECRQLSRLSGIHPISGSRSRPA